MTCSIKSTNLYNNFKSLTYKYSLLLMLMYTVKPKDHSCLVHKNVSLLSLRSVIMAGKNLIQM